MDASLLERLRSRTREQNLGVTFWMPVAQALSNQLSLLLPRGPWAHDEVPALDNPAGFRLWIWSRASDEPSFIGWSCLMTGGWSASAEEDEGFSASATLLLFDGKASDHRVVTSDGRSIVEFSYDLAAARWKCLGWNVDEWGEWDVGPQAR